MSDIDLVLMVGGLSVGKPEDAASIADSALGTSSVVTGASFAGVHEVSCAYTPLSSVANSGPESRYHTPVLLSCSLTYYQLSQFAIDPLPKHVFVGSGIQKKKRSSYICH